MQSLLINVQNDNKQSILDAYLTIFNTPYGFPFIKNLAQKITVSKRKNAH